jgi:hypothetical protein
MLSVPAFAQEKAPALKPIKIAKKTSDVISHEDFDALLKKFVDEKGQVNYKALKKDRVALDAYLTEIGSAEIVGSADAKLAFYINAYNAIVIDTVLKNKRRGVMKIKGFFKEKTHKVAGKMITLDHLENGIVRKDFNEARIHFVLVCGAKSCPRLRQEAATEKNVQKMMESAAKEFIPLATKVKGKKVKTSQLFNWFEEDFVKAEGSVGAYLAKYLPEHAELLKSKKAKIKFSKYSWKLNKQ